MGKIVVAGLVLATAFGLAGCDTTRTLAQRSDALSAAGFTSNQADTPKKLASVKAMPQHQMLVSSRKGKNFYVYADAEGCQCLYVGDELSFQSYKKIRVQEKLADQQEMTASMNEDAAIEYNNWGAWGYDPYWPGYYR